VTGFNIHATGKNIVLYDNTILFGVPLCSAKTPTARATILLPPLFYTRYIEQHWIIEKKPLHGAGAA